MNDPQSTFETPEWSVHSLARNAIDDAVINIVRKTAGEEALRTQSIWANSTFTRHAPTAAEGIKAALALRSAAANALDRFVRDARAQGDSWQMVAVLLGFKDEDDRGNSPAERAFELVAGPPRPFEHVSTSWTCRSCSEVVVDRGPFESHPEDNESGHAGYEDKSGPKCSRFKAEIAAWRRRNR